MEFPSKLSTAAMARLLSVHERSLTRLVERRILTKDARGTFDTIDTVADYVAHREAVVAAEHGAGAFGRARADLFLERSRITRMQREQMEGALIPAADIRAAWSTILTNLCGRLLAIPSKLAPRLAIARTAAQAKKLVEDEVNEALSEAREWTVEKTPPARAIVGSRARARRAPGPGAERG